MKNSHLEIKFKIWLEQNKLLAYFGEQVPILKPSRFWKSKKSSWRIDFLSEELKIVVEIQGGTFSYGGHSRGAGQHSDFDKINHLQNLGYRVFQFDTQHVRENDYVELLEAIK